jgi:glycosyltransferase involved in cell wall biosynthesis
MISVCIPIYNFNVTELVKTLSSQLKLLEIPSEIILIDDCSDNSFKKANLSICEKEVYIQLEKNIGRAAIRNRFLEYAKYEYLLFLDCDLVVPSNDFLDSYIDAINKNPNQLISGGLKYQDFPPKRDKMLRWKYGIKRESIAYEIRRQNSNKSFLTSNFVISRILFETVKFDERLAEYGHEDTLFGFELKNRNINIVHIDNPILSVDLVNNKKYISNTEKAVCNLIHILEFVNYDKNFIKDVTLLRMYFKWYKMRKIIMILFFIFKPIIKYSLAKGFVNLYAFDFYKLGILTLKMNNK